MKSSELSVPTEGPSRIGMVELTLSTCWPYKDDERRRTQLCVDVYNQRAQLDYMHFVCLSLPPFLTLALVRKWVFPSLNSTAGSKSCNQHSHSFPNPHLYMSFFALPRLCAPHRLHRYQTCTKDSRKHTHVKIIIKKASERDAQLTLFLCCATYSWLTSCCKWKRLCVSFVFLWMLSSLDIGMNCDTLFAFTQISLLALTTVLAWYFSLALRFRAGMCGYNNNLWCCIYDLPYSVTYQLLSTLILMHAGMWRYVSSRSVFSGGSANTS